MWLGSKSGAKRAHDAVDYSENRVIVDQTFEAEWGARPSKKAKPGKGGAAAQAALLESQAAKTFRSCCA